jgi:steroid 5-alpha reductase family enzyme
MNAALIAWNAGALLIYMSLVFAIAYKRKRLDTVDVAWGGGFVVVAWLVAGLEPQVRTLLIAILVDIWAIRLSNHIMERSKRRGEDDPRYTELASKWNQKNYWMRAYVSVFLLQGALVLLISLPTVFAAGDSLSFAVPLTVLGMLIWVAGFATETAADYQLQQFLNAKTNKGKVLDKGLWHYSRHPNYLGEITQWYGIGIIACSASYGWIGLIGPLVLNFIIRFVSGVPPIEKRKQKDPAYQKYMQHTNALLPRLLRSSSASN